MFLTPAGLHGRRHGSVRARASAGTTLADGKVVDFYELLNVSGPVVNASGSQQLRYTPLCLESILPGPSTAGPCLSPLMQCHAMSKHIFAYQQLSLSSKAPFTLLFMLRSLTQSLLLYVSAL
jgi:hypothetical protein